MRKSIDVDKILNFYDKVHAEGVFQPLNAAASNMMYIDPETGEKMVSTLPIEVGIYIQREIGHIIEVVQAERNDCQNTLIYYVYNEGDEPKSTIANDFDWYREFERVGEV